jgi:hypothetical protein
MMADRLGGERATHRALAVSSGREGYFLTRPRRLDVTDHTTMITASRAHPTLTPGGTPMKGAATVKAASPATAMSVGQPGRSRRTISNTPGT